MPRSLVLLALALALTLSCPVARAGSVIQADQCTQQIENWVRPDVDCVAMIRFVADASIPALLQPILNGSSCTVPLKFQKKDVYNTWIQANSVKVPKLSVTCVLGTTGLAAAQFQTMVSPACERKPDRWMCTPGISDTIGLGVLGTILEAYVNSDAGIIASMNKALEDASH